MKLPFNYYDYKATMRQTLLGGLDEVPGREAGLRIGLPLATKVIALGRLGSSGNWALDVKLGLAIIPLASRSRVCKSGNAPLQIRR